MADPLDPVGPGRPALPLSAATENLIREAARAYRRTRRGNVGGPKDLTPLDANEIRLKLSALGSTTILDAFSIQAIGEPVIDPEDPPFEAQRIRLFAGATVSDAAEPFAITQQPIRGNTIGRALASGVAFCWVDVTDLDHTRAVPVVGESGYLASAASGGVPILWRETGLATVLAAVLLDHGEDNAATLRESRPAVLTESSGAASWQGRTLSSGSWIASGSAHTNDGYPFLLAGPTINAPFAARPTAPCLVWDEPAGSGQYGFLPIQEADKQNGTYYAGYVSTGAQTWTGAKTIEGSGSHLTLSDGPSLILQGTTKSVRINSTDGAANQIVISESPNTTYIDADEIDCPGIIRAGLFASGLQYGSSGLISFYNTAGKVVNLWFTNGIIDTRTNVEP